MFGVSFLLFDLWYCVFSCLAFGVLVSWRFEVLMCWCLVFGVCCLLAGWSVVVVWCMLFIVFR